MFVEFNYNNNYWKKINGTIGVSRIVSFGKNPTVVSSDIIAALIKRCDEFSKLKPKIKLKEGEKVKVIRGPFTNFIATIDEIEPQKRIWLLLDFMGQKTKLKLHEKDLSICL